MTQLSIIIPATGSQESLDETLVSVLENRPSECEVILVHRESYVDPYDLADEVRLVAADDVDEIGLWNTGLSHCQGRFVHMLRPGMTVGNGWSEPALELFEQDSDIGSVSPCIVASGYRKTIQGIDYDVVSGKRIVRDGRRRILAPLLGVGFFRVSAIRFMHGYNLRFGNCADVELGLRMRSANYKCAKCESRIHSNSKLTYRPEKGYGGGRIRADLFRAARRVQMASAVQGWLGACGESLNNGFGPGTVSSLWGRMAATYFTPDAAGTISMSAAEEPAKEQQRRAA